MRTALFFVALSIHDVAVALGGSHFDSVGLSFMTGFMLVFIGADITELLKKEKV